MGLSIVSFTLDVELKLLIKSMVTLGSSVNFSCQSSILSHVIYQWEHNETLLHNETSAILRITNMQWDKTGVYCCTVTTKNNVSVKSPKGYLIIHGPGEKSL